jgi:hypothetical protein
MSCPCVRARHYTGVLPGESLGFAAEFRGNCVSPRAVAPLGRIAKAVLAPVAVRGASPDRRASTAALPPQLREDRVALASAQRVMQFE